jgi:hypothetical protein
METKTVSDQSHSYTNAVVLEARRRMYRWAIDEMKSEIQGDFPLMSRLWGGGAETLIEMLSVYSIDERVAVALLFLESMYGDITEPSLKSLEVKNAYLKRARFAPLGKGINERMTPLFDGTAVDDFKLERQEMVGALKELFGAKKLGAKIKAGAGEAVTFASSFGDWTVETGFIVRAGTQNVLDMTHSVVDGNRGLLICTDYARVLGVGSTTWQYMRKIDLPDAIETIGMLVRKFYEAVPTIIRDIPHDYM